MSKHSERMADKLRDIKWHRETELTLSWNEQQLGLTVYDIIERQNCQITKVTVEGPPVNHAALEDALKNTSCPSE